METRDFWRPTKAAAARMAALGIHPERREPPYATMYYGGTDLPDEFVVVDSGTPACETVIGLATEPVAVVMAKAAALAVGADASVIQLWEGRVLGVDSQNEVMSVLLCARIGQVPDHTGEIDLQWVSDQDRDLVQPGAVFYLTLFKRLRRGSVENAQELRFRRRPAWSRQQIQRIQADAAMLRSKMKARPIAE